MTVKVGAFADLRGICQDKDRVTILLSVLGRAVPVTMARAAVA